ncbi:dihydroneopterin aldolase [Paraburkholderia terrae]|uniref:Dihydroneopterin aldolase n=1 Tax=Paraburkholderia terrae TaxID=311230 RepID=A0ABM7U0Q4_9BURK|nr:dihydroneopterin aldolase [Paraburkholderia terrae]BCZ84912.1 dihydroneopterin aldolase [Paraburkholderia terrae]BDC44888.1 dihydroneopterin aldolase [Paraburkholderia terrae]
MKPSEGCPAIEWDVVIEQLRAQTRVGIHAHERAAQPVVIEATLHCRSHALPQHIDDCLDYDAFCRMLQTYLDEQTHTDLVERLAADLLVLAFSRFAMLDDAVLTLYKPHAVRSAERVGVRLRWSRCDFLRWRARDSAAYVAAAA